MRKNVLITGPYIPGKHFGGPVKSLINMVETLNNEFSFYIATGDRDLGASTPYSSVDIGLWNEIGKAKVFYLPKGQEFKYILRIFKEIDFDLVYCSSFFEKKSILIQIMKWLRFIKKPVIVAPRGEFSPSAIKMKAKKKKVYLKLYKMLKIQNAIAFTCTSENDKRDILRVLGDNTTIFIAGNIVNYAVVNKSLNHKEKGQLKMVTVSRIAPIKNIDYSLQLLKQISEIDFDFKIYFDIYGPMEDQIYWNKCLSIIREIRDKVVVNYNGPLEYADVISQLSNYHVFLLPTKGENFGHVIQEAFLAGCPVILSDQTPWKELKEFNVGFDISLSNHNAFIKAIQYYLAMDENEYRKVSNQALEFGINKINNQTSIKEHLEMFEELMDNT